MQRRQFLRNGLLLGATGLIPGVGLAASKLLAFPVTAVPVAAPSETIWDAADPQSFSFDADVVLVGPKGLAVALKWDENTMNAPEIQAKGKDWRGKRIQEVALIQNIPIVEHDMFTKVRCVSLKAH